VDLNCGNLVDREDLGRNDARASQASKSAAKRHGLNVLERALQQLSTESTTVRQYHVVGHEAREPQGFEEIFKSAYSLLLHQLGTSELLKQGASTSEAALYLTPATGVARARKSGPKKSATKSSVPVCSYDVLTSSAHSL
jgi:hypothetical protein